MESATIYGETALAAAKRDLLFTPNLGNYGYGWVNETKAGVTYAWHNGALSPVGFTSFMIRVPSKDRFVTYLVNRDPEKIRPFQAKVTALTLK